MKALLPFVVGLPLLLASTSTSRLLRFLSFFRSSSAWYTLEVKLT